LSVGDAKLQKEIEILKVSMIVYTLEMTIA